MAQERNQLAEGLWLLSAGAIIQAVIVAKKLADKMLSKTAIAKADVVNDELHYPEADGRASIPMLELSQKGYIELQAAQIKEHIHRLMKMVPDYLKERGIFQKPVETLGSKIEKDYNNYIAHVKYMKKSELINKAAEIADMQRIKDFISKAELPLANMGLLLKKENLLQEIRTKALLGNPAEHPDLLLTRGRLTETVQEICEELSKDEEIVKQAVTSFENELAVAKKLPYQSITFTLKVPDLPERQITMSVQDFYKHMDTAMLKRFSETHMQDFPAPDYYGEQETELYDKTRCKRFCENIKEHFFDISKDLAPGYVLHIDNLNKEAVNVNTYDALQDRMLYKKFAEANYDEPEIAVSHIKTFIKEQSDLLKEVQNMLQEPLAEQVTPAVEEKQNNAESAEGNETMGQNVPEQIESEVKEKTQDKGEEKGASSEVQSTIEPRSMAADPEEPKPVAHYEEIESFEELGG